MLLAFLSYGIAAFLNRCLKPLVLASKSHGQVVTKIACGAGGRSIFCDFLQHLDDMKDGETQSLSQVLISTGVAFAARDRSGRPLFPEYAQAEEVAQKARAGIWARPLFLHPYGERYRANPLMN